jgi:hypothetical protein
VTEIIKIVGAFYRPPAKAVLTVLQAGAKLRVIPEPDNPHDENAQKVAVSPNQILEDQHTNLQYLITGHGMELGEILEMESIHLGYLPRDEAERLVSKIPDEGLDGELAFTLEGAPAIKFSLLT